MTKGDYIRSMTDRELAIFLCDISNNGGNYLFKIPGVGNFIDVQDVEEALKERGK